MTHPHMFLHMLVRWVDLVALISFLGGVSYYYFVWPPLNRQIGRGNGMAVETAVVLVVLAAAAVIDLVLRAMMMSGRPLMEVMSVIPIVLTETRFGPVWICKFGTIILLTVLWLLKKRGFLNGTIVKYPSLAGAAAVALTTTLSGHAADQGIWSGTVLVDWIHVMAVSGWIGGLFALQLHFRPLLAGFAEKERRDLLAVALRRFSAVAMTAVGAMLLTGIYNTWIHVHSRTLLVSTDYGKILILKWLLIVPMVLLGGMNRFYGLPNLENREGRGLAGALTRAARSVIERIWTRPKNMGQLCFRMLLVEAILGVAVLGCTAALTQLPPPHAIPVEFKHDHHAM